MGTRDMVSKLELDDFKQQTAEATPANPKKGAYGGHKYLLDDLTYYFTTYTKLSYTFHVHLHNQEYHRG